MVPPKALVSAACVAIAGGLCPQGACAQFFDHRSAPIGAFPVYMEPVPTGSAGPTPPEAFRDAARSAAISQIFPIRLRPSTAASGPAATVSAYAAPEASVPRNWFEERFYFLGANVPIPREALNANASAPLPPANPAPTQAAHAPAKSPVVARTEPVPMPRAAPRRLAMTAPVQADVPLRMGTVAVPSVEPPSAAPAEDVPRPPAPIGSEAEIRNLVTAKAAEQGVPVALAHAVVRVESNYKPHLTGRGHTVGLMQIKYPTARALGYSGTAKGLYDPATNIEWGMRYLAGAHKLAHGDVCRTVMKYQGGHRVTQPNAASLAYCRKVRAYMAESPRARRLAEAPAAR